jgi:hypothetical protein
MSMLCILIRFIFFLKKKPCELCLFGKEFQLVAAYENEQSSSKHSIIFCKDPR